MRIPAGTQLFYTDHGVLRVVGSFPSPQTV